MSPSSSDTLQPTSALHREETERITGQKSRDWDRVKAIPYCREQQAFRGTNCCSRSLQTALAGGHRSHCCRYESNTLSRSAPSKNSHVHNRTRIYIRYQRTRQVEGTFPVWMEVVGLSYCPSKSIDVWYTVFPFEISINADLMTICNFEG